MPAWKLNVPKTGSNTFGQIASAITITDRAIAMIRLSRLIRRRPYPRTAKSANPSAAMMPRNRSADMGG